MLSGSHVSAVGARPATVRTTTTRLLILVAAVAVGCSPVHRAPVPESPPRELAAERFLDVWKHSLSTSWAVQETFDRTTRAGRKLTYPVHRAQRPPDHLITGLGTVDVRSGGKLSACELGVSEELVCKEKIGASDYDKSVADQLATLRTLVTGTKAIYSVGQLAGCFELRLLRPSFPVPPYGRVAVFCFDPTTGAPAGSVVGLDAGTDRTTVTDAHSPATDADLVIPTGHDMTAINKLAHAGA